MAQSDNKTWDFGRFLQTLSYFEAIPVLSWIQKMLGATPASPPQPQADVIFDFRSPSIPLDQTWGALDDVVMGGVSASVLQTDPEGASFTGRVSTSNSGGFASVRTRNFEPALNLAGASGLILRVKGDGNRYKFLIRDGESWESVAYAFSFDTVPGEWIDVQIPFANLVPVFRAKTVENAPPLDIALVRSLQLMLSKFEYDGALNPHFNPGSFTLCIQSIQRR
ncbi:MAG: CIA30 family protein [Thermosynechococcaceae cyanobacterium MS004]|nr:CIA30 family protein [Thermosynechococcaceae cyanobacterium MS004]